MKLSSKWNIDWIISENIRACLIFWVCKVQTIPNSCLLLAILLYFTRDLTCSSSFYSWCDNNDLFSSIWYGSFGASKLEKVILRVWFMKLGLIFYKKWLFMFDYVARESFTGVLWWRQIFLINIISINFPEAGQMGSQTSCLARGGLGRNLGHHCWWSKILCVSLLL